MSRSLAQMRARGVTFLALILSDVIGDRLDVIGSGPTVPDASRFSDAIAVVKKYDLLRVAPTRVVEHPLLGKQARTAETPKGEMPLNVRYVVVGSNRLADLFRTNTAGCGSSVRLSYFPSSVTPTICIRVPSRIL
jgi:glycerate 2-kinase